MRLNPPKNRPEQDIVYTPVPLAIDIIEHYQPEGIILDPSKGDGAFYNNFPEDVNNDWCELSLGRNFFDYEDKCDWIITNPPWSMMRKFLIHGMELSDNIVYLTSVNHYTTKARLRDMHEHGFGIREFYCFDTPKEFPQSGFQLAAVHTQRGWTGPAEFTFSSNFSALAS